MITKEDIKIYLRDLIYIQEDVYNIIANSRNLSKKNKAILLDNVKEKQIIITKLIQFFNSKKYYETKS